MAKKNKNAFKNKIKDLDDQEFEHPEDFFAKAKAMQEQTTDEPRNPIQQLGNMDDEMWIDAGGEGFEGQLAVDVYQDKKNLYIVAIVGGINPEDIEVHLNNDMITIKGKRIPLDENVSPEQYYIRECYWGGFSRSIILPVDIINDQVTANTENGVITITLPKSRRPKNTRIPIKSK